MFRKISFAFCALFLTLGNASEAQPYPSVRLNIANIQQETIVWCWAAVAQQIIYAKRGHSTPAQCEMVAISNNLQPKTCCHPSGRWNGNPFCLRTGSIHQIQGLIHHFGGSYSNLAPPTNPMVVYNTLAQNRPIIMGVRASVYQQVGHVVIITGIEWVPSQFGPQPVLHINDPMNLMTNLVPFDQIARYWEYAIVVTN